MKYLNRTLFTALMLSFVTSANAGMIQWDFTAEVSYIYRDDANQFDGLQQGSLLTGSFAYDDSLMFDTPLEYSNYVETTDAFFTIDQLNFFSTELEVSVVRQSSRDILDVEADQEYADGSEASVELGFLDYTQSYGTANVPSNWDIPPVDFSDIELSFTFDDPTLDDTYNSWLIADLTNITRSNVNADVPEPAGLALLFAGISGLFIRRRMQAAA